MITVCQVTLPVFRHQKKRKKKRRIEAILNFFSLNRFINYAYVYRLLDEAFSIAHGGAKESLVKVSTITLFLFIKI